MEDSDAEEPGESEPLVPNESLNKNPPKKSKVKTKQETTRPEHLRNPNDLTTTSDKIRPEQQPNPNDTQKHFLSVTGDHRPTTSSGVSEDSKRPKSPFRKSRFSSVSHLHPLQEFNENNGIERTCSLETKVGSEEQDDEPSPSPSLFCPMFGVRNYLHNFYEKAELKDESLYDEIPKHPCLRESESEIFLVKQREGICSSSVFRLSLFLGGIILTLGAAAFIVAACSSRRATLVGMVGGVSVVDRVAAAHNAEVDALLLVALIAVTLGATVLSSALISRTFCSKPEFDEVTGGFPAMSSYEEYDTSPPFISEKKVPATKELTPVQPWAEGPYGRLN